MKNCLTRLVLFSPHGVSVGGHRVRTGHHRFTQRQSSERTQEGVAGASVIAIHLPSGTTYETTSRADGRFIRSSTCASAARTR